MATTTLPIDIVPNTHPPKFRWKQAASTPLGPRIVDCEGELPASVESAVAELITLAKSQAQEIVGLRRTVENITAQLDAQTELLKAAEVQPTALPMHQSTGRRKG